MRAGVAVVPPGAAQAGRLLDDDEVGDAGLAQLDRHAQPGHAGAEDQHLVLDARIGGGRRGRERSQALDRGVGAGQQAGVDLEHVPAAQRDLAAHRHTGGLQRVVQRQCLAVQHLVGAALHQRRRQAAQVGLQRRGLRPAGRHTAQIVTCAGLGPGPAEHGLTLGRLQRRAFRRHVGPGREQQQRRGKRLAGVAQREREHEGQAAAGRVAADHHRAARLQRMEGGERVVARGRETVLGREPVVEREDLHAGVRGQPRGERAVRCRRAHAIGAAVQVEQRARARRRRCRPHPFASHAADAGRLEAHAARHPVQVRQRGEPAALPADGHARREHRLEQQLQRQAQQGGDESLARAPGLKVVHRHRLAPKLGTFSGRKRGRLRSPARCLLRCGRE